VRLHRTKAKECLESGKVACIAEVQVGRRTATTSPTAATTTAPPATTTTTTTEATCSQKQLTKSPSTATVIHTNDMARYVYTRSAQHSSQLPTTCPAQLANANHTYMQRALANSAGKTHFPCTGACIPSVFLRYAADTKQRMDQVGADARGYRDSRIQHRGRRSVRQSQRGVW
jgi:hypothetical protein